MPISSPNPMFDHLLESSHRDDSSKWSNIGFGEEITQVESKFILHIWNLNIISYLVNLFKASGGYEKNNH